MDLFDTDIGKIIAVILFVVIPIIKSAVQKKNKQTPKTQYKGDSPASQKRESRQDPAVRTRKTSIQKTPAPAVKTHTVFTAPPLRRTPAAPSVPAAPVKTGSENTIPPAQDGIQKPLNAKLMLTSGSMKKAFLFSEIFNRKY